MANIKAAMVGETVMCVANAQAPEPAAWDAYMVVLKQHMDQRGGQPGRLVVFGGGGTPTSQMRLQLKEVIAKRPLLTAVVTDSAVVRGIISVFSLFVDGTKPFAVKDWKEGLKYVGFPMEKLGEVNVVVKKLDADVGGSPAVAPDAK